MFEQAYALIQQYDRIIIHRHSKPDGDAIGSQVGMKHLILENFPGKTVYTVGDPAGRYSFIEDSETDQIPDEAYQGALAIILDTSASALISDDRYKLAACRLRIDHHLFCEKIAEVEIVGNTYESCCGLVTAFADECGLRISPIAAQALYTGMVTDSGRFRYDATSSQTFRMAAKLLEAGLDTNRIYTNLYADDYEMLKLRAQYILKIQFFGKNIAYIYTTREELAALKRDSSTISRGMVNTMSDIKGVDTWVNFTETDQGLLCELRSSKFNINPIAVKYGGGGHAKACGATVKTRDDAMAMLRDLELLCQ